MRLSRLSSARALNVRFTTPGHANPLFLDRPRLLDPAHPAARLSVRHLPAVISPHFTIRAFPNPLLHHPAEFVPINPILATGLVRARTNTHPRHKWWSNLDTTPDDKPHRRATPDAKRRSKYLAARRLADAHVAALAARGRHNVSLLFHTSKKATSKSCVVRRRLRSKMTIAIGLIVTRNADAVDMDVPERGQPVNTPLSFRLPTRPIPPKNAPLYPPLSLVSRPPQENESFVLQDWTYLIVPNLAIYKMPLPNLVQAVRKALLSLCHHSKRLEASWSAIPKRKPSLHHKPSACGQPPHGVADGSHPATRTRTQRLQSQCSDTPAKQRTSPQLYVHRPLFLPHERLGAK